MYCTKKITDDMFWVGGNDRRISLFENVFPVPDGVSYNSYLINDEKTVLLDTTDHSIGNLFIENVCHVLNGKKLDYLIINHMEPDHCSLINDIVIRYPDVKIVGNSKTITMIKQFFNFDIDSHAVVIQEGEELCTGRHTLQFIMAPMVHWPEAMVTYDKTDKILYSADAFGTFGAINGNLFADEMDFEHKKLDDARRYYTNIVGKYGAQVQTLLKKTSSVEIKMICPLHGPVWRENINWFIEKYQKWSTYTPENNSVMIAYASIYGNTANAAEILASKLSDLGVKDFVVYDVSSVDPSVIVSEAFRCSHIVFASSTYNAGIFCNMETVLTDLKAHNLQNRTVAVIQNGSWAPASGKLIRDILSGMKNMTILENAITIKSSLKENQIEEIDVLAASIVNSMQGKI